MEINYQDYARHVLEKVLTECGVTNFTKSPDDDAPSVGPPTLPWALQSIRVLVAERNQLKAELEKLKLHERTESRQPSSRWSDNHVHTSPTEKELDLLVNLCSDLRSEAWLYSHASQQAQYTPDQMAHFAWVSRDNQSRANALLSALQTLGAKGLPQPLSFPEDQ